MQEDIRIFSSHENHMYSVVRGSFGLNACESVLSHSLWVKRLHSPPAGLCSVFPCQELNLGGGALAGGEACFPRARTSIVALHLMLKASMDTQSPWLLS